MIQLQQEALEKLKRDTGLDSVVLKEIKQEIDFSQPAKFAYRQVNLPTLLQPSIGDAITLFNQYFQDDIMSNRQQFPVVDIVLEQLEIIKQLQYGRVMDSHILVLFPMQSNF